MKKNILIVSALILLLAGCASPAFNSDMYQGEHLITPYYADVEDWEVSEQQVNNFSSRIWQQPGKGMADAYSVSVFYDQVSVTSQRRNLLDAPGLKACDTFTSTTLSFPLDLPYPIEYWETLCANNNGTRAKLLHLIIQGKNNVYHIQKSWQGDIPANLVQQWKTKFETIFVCDTRTNAVECPKVQKLTEL